MIIYEVNLTVQADVAEALAAWLPGHIREVIALPGFLGATWYDDVEAGGPERRWVVQYRLRDEADMRRYFEEFADQMRRDGMERFGGRFDASRRVLRPKEEFTAADAASGAE